jgi:anti-sigma regulatory factor (Ser/Thr protein kinase)
LGVMEEALYTAACVDLVLGDCLLVITDGVSEAHSPQGSMFDDTGVARWFAAPAHEPPQAQDLVAVVRDFEAGAPPSDDVAIILFRLQGRLRPFELTGDTLLETTLKPAPEAVSTIVEQVLELLEERGVDARCAHHAALVLDEMLTNIDTHAGGLSCSVWVTLASDRVGVAIEDQAPPFDPRQLSAPDTNATLENRPIGGLGAHLVLSFARDFSYRSERGRNMTTLWIARAGATNSQ